MTVAELAKEIGAEVIGDGSASISSCATLEAAGPGQISFLSNPRYARDLETTRASAVIVGKGIGSEKTTLLRTGDPYFAFMKAVVRLHGHRKHPFTGVHPQAFVDPSATIGSGTVIYPGAYVGARTRIGTDCILYPNVAIYEDCTIGNRVIVQACAVIGVDGYGFATHKGEHHKMPQIGSVVIEDDVEIGACCSIERGALQDTVIGRGTKIDQLVVVGHGSRIGEHCLLVAQTGIAGSVTLGHHVTLAGQTGVAGHLTIGNNVTASAKSGIMSDIEDQRTVMGQPAMEAAHARRVYLHFMQLPDLVERVKMLEQQVAELSGEGEGAEVV
jgi:UDP-3-O-[3-hydroxymyristoyl] glucosamine N-acyltransferase